MASAAAPPVARDQAWLFQINHLFFIKNYPIPSILRADFDGAEEMIVIVVFLAVVGVAAGVAVWNERRRPWCDGGRERLEPRFPLGSI